MKKPSVLLIYVNYSTFVEADDRILSTFSDVFKYQFRPVKGIFRVFIELIREFFFLLSNGLKYDVYFIWFGDYHSLVPVLFARLFRKKSFVVIGGYDVSTLTEFKYGSMSHPVRAFFTRMTFKYAGMSLPVADALKDKLLQINPKAKAMTVATASDPCQFTFDQYERPKSVVTVSTTDNHQRMMVKGLDRFKELALSLPDFEMVIVGATDRVKSYFEPLPSNMVLHPPAPFGQLEQYYRNASFYAQLSRSEGLPNALCESMLCGCIPVGTNVGDINVTIGNTGCTVKDWNPDLLAGFIRNHHNVYALRDAARNRIIERYKPELRIAKLKSLLISG